MARKYHLFSPTNIGVMELRNRLAMSVITTNYSSPNFEVTERLVKYYETRATGEAASDTSL